MLKSGEHIEQLHCFSPWQHIWPNYFFGYFSCHNNMCSLQFFFFSKLKNLQLKNIYYLPSFFNYTHCVVNAHKSWKYVNLKLSKGDNNVYMLFTWGCSLFPWKKRKGRISWSINHLIWNKLLHACRPLYSVI